jgi:polyisoprenoid-binding protein YceI
MIGRKQVAVQDYKDGKYYQKMKNSIKNIAALVFVSFIVFSFVTKKSDRKNIKVSESKVVWKGYKVTGAHEGILSIKSGQLNFDKEIFTGGSFKMDMSTITVTDLEGEYKSKLEGHLKSDDFFGVEKFPTASLVFTKVKFTSKNSYEVTGDLTIKGKKNVITFNVSIYGNKANATLKIDRTKFGVRYGSGNFFDGLKDKAIYDEFDLVVDLVF